MKKCVTCLEIKHLADFYKRKDSSDGLRNDCKCCRKARSIQNYFVKHEQNKEAKKKQYLRRLKENPNYNAELYMRNRDKSLAISKEYYNKNKEKVKAKVKEWARNNHGKTLSYSKMYKTKKIQRTPTWLTEDDMFLISEAYELAALRTQMFGFPWHVDHIIPLRGKTVSGLHVPWNLQVIPGAENMRKSNRYLV